MWKRKRLWALLLLISIPGVAMLVLTRTDTLKGSVLGGIESSLGCRAEADSVRLAWNGDLVVRELRLYARGVSEPGAQVLYAPSVVADVDWGSTVGGTPTVNEFQVVRPLVRVSQHHQSGALNVTALRTAGGGSETFTIPRFTIVDGQIELGEHSDDWYTPLTSLRVDGSGAQLANDPDVYRFRFAQRNAAGQPAADATSLEGTFDLATGTLSTQVEGLDLSEWSDRSLPSAYQPFWETLGLRGRIPLAKLIYTPGSPMVFEVGQIEDVRFRLPLDLREEEGQQLVDIEARTASLSFGPDGFDADVVGRVGDVPMRLTLHADAFSPETAARALINIQDFELASSPELLPVAPGMAEDVVARFRQPTGIINATVVLERGAPTGPGQPGEWRYDGDVYVTDGRANYFEFPYPIEDLDAHFRFDEGGFEIVTCTGRTGAGTVNAIGTIEPLGDGAEVDIDVFVRGVALDDAFRDAMPESRRILMDVLFDRAAHARLLEAGVFTPSDEPIPGVPSFDIGGSADLDIDIFRPLGMDSRYTTNIDVTIARAGFVPMGFAYPVVGQGVRLQITPRRAVISDAQLVGLTGMTGSIAGEVFLGPGPDDVRPELTITARDMPIDRVLAQALPDDQLERGTGGGGSPRDALEGLDLRGRLDGSADVLLLEDGRLGFVVDAVLDGVRSAPDAALRLENVSGALRITRDDLQANGLAGTIGGAPFDGTIGIVFPRPLYGVTASLTGDFHATGVELAAPFERFASRFDEKGSAALREMREEFAPTGRVDASFRFTQRADGPIGYMLTLEPRSDLGLTVLDERWDFEQPAGLVELTPGRLRFDGFSAAMGVEGAERHSVLLDGVLVYEGATTGTLHASASGVGLRSGTVEASLLDRLPDVHRALDELGIADGVLDAQAIIAFEGNEKSVAWSVAPSAIDLDREGVRTPVDASGTVSGTNADVVVRDLELVSDAWTLRLDGHRDEDGTGSFDVRLDASGIDDGLLSLIPPEAADALRGLELRVTERLTVSEATLTLRPDAGPALNGAIGYTGASLRVGALIEEAAGTGRVYAAADRFDLSLYVSSARAARILVEDATVVAKRESVGGPLLIPSITGRVHDGVLDGRGVVRTGKTPVTFELNAELAQVAFGGVLEDLGVGSDKNNRGVMDAGFSMHGRLGVPAERRGRATVRVQGGRVLDLPGIIPLLELSNLQAPNNERVNLGYLDLFVAGDEALVDRMTLFSDSLRIAGVGRVDLPTLGVDLSFSTYGSNWVPILSPLIEGIREEIASTRVTGTLQAPEFRTEQLTSTRALLDAIRGPQLQDQAQDQSPAETPPASVAPGATTDER